jgi:hypothetical protein
VVGEAVGRSGPGIAYTSTLRGPGCVIRSNAIVIFDVELVDVKG